MYYAQYYGYLVTDTFPSYRLKLYIFYDLWYVCSRYSTGSCYNGTRYLVLSTSKLR